MSFLSFSRPLSKVTVSSEALQQLALTLSPLSSQSMGSPDLELPDTTLFVAVFFRNFQADIPSLREYIKDLQASVSALREFVMVGEGGFSALRSERVKLDSTMKGYMTVCYMNLLFTVLTLIELMKAVSQS